MKADEIFETIQQLEDAERWQLLNMMFDEYFNTRENVKGEEIDY